MITCLEQVRRVQSCCYI